MHADKWVVVAKVGDSIEAKRSDSSGDMEQFELMEVVLLSDHENKEAAEAAAAARRAKEHGWTFSVLPRCEYDDIMRRASGKRGENNP